jgi:glycosyltransferase involved in cell wall biosynthesis
MRLVFDVTRLVRRGHLPAPTGIDRIEHEYLAFLLAQDRLDLAFEAYVAPAGWVSLSRPAVTGLMNAQQRRWSGRAGAASALGVLRHLRPVPSRRGAGTRFLTVSHPGAPAIAQWRRRADACGGKIVYFVHDLIPVEYPEYALAKHAAANRARIAAATTMADGLLVNSDCTAGAVARFCGAASVPPIVKLPFGSTLRDSGTAAPASAGDHPYFLVVGTIEPRKNHLLLLKMWRDMARHAGAAAPHLVIAGRRGWENGHILAMIDRSPALRDVLVELQTPSDAALHALMRGARALLAPSFAEGFDLPVAEALGLGCPVIASDIPAHREVGGDAPLFLHPLDAKGWSAAVRDFAAPDSPLREDHLRAARAWRPASWDDHFSRLTDFLDQL